MQYRYFECKCGHTFHSFVEFQQQGLDDTYKAGVFKVTGTTDLPTATCEKCGTEAALCLADPEALGTKLLFNYMEP